MPALNHAVLHNRKMSMLMHLSYKDSTVIYCKRGSSYPRLHAAAAEHIGNPDMLSAARAQHPTA